MLIEISLTILVSLALSLGLNRMMLTVAPRLGLMDEPGARRIHTQSIPRAGGIAIWLSFLLVTGGGLATGLIKSQGHFSWPWLGAFAASSAVLMIAGFFDDRAGLSPWVKLGAHVLAPTVFFLLFPIQTGLFPADWPIACDYAFFVIWAVVLINAFNLIDGLDGLCGGLAAVSAFAMAGMALTHNRLDSALLLFAMGGAILGFLKFNINPARIFLGDAGSMLMGFFLATAATDAVGRKAMVGVFLLPIAVAGVPLLDVLLAIWRRGMRRLLKQLRGEKIEGGIFEADSDHLHHRLLASGGSQRKAAVALQGLAILLAVLAFMPLVFGNQLLALSLVGFLIVALVGVRSLARVEIEHTGRVIHMAIKLPGHRRRVAAVLFVYDLLVLAGAGVAAVIIETNHFILLKDAYAMAQYGMVFLTLGSLALWAVRVHRRLWVRATMRDIISLQIALLAAAMATFTIFSLVYASLEWSALRLALISYVFASGGVCLPRVALDLLRELGLDARHQRAKHVTEDQTQAVVIFGAGSSGTLLLDHLKSSSHDVYPDLRILGFLDDMKVLHGRRIRSFQILGDLSAVPKLVKDEGLKGIVLAIRHPSKEALVELDRLADRYNLKVYRWKAELVER